ncbi:enoyl-CoA hydratase-related protein [Deltaproteobacteria bacterium TL4]
MIDLRNFEHHQIKELLTLFDTIFGNHPSQEEVTTVLTFLNTSVRKIVSIVDDDNPNESVDPQLNELIAELKNHKLTTKAGNNQISQIINSFVDLFKTYYKFVDKNKRMVSELCNVFRIITEVYLRTDPHDEPRKKEIRVGINDLVENWLAGKIIPPSSSQEFEDGEDFLTSSEHIEVGPHEGLPQLDTVELELQGQVALVKLNRPEKHNAMNRQMLGDIDTAFRVLEHSEETRVIVLTGNGKTFCSGADLGEMKSTNRMHQQEEWSVLFVSVLRRILDCPKPVVAVIHGPVMGGGIGLMCAADIILSSDHVMYAFPEVRLGIAPAIISPLVLPRIGVSQSKRLMLTGERFNARQAKEWGLIHEIAAPEALAELQHAFVSQLLQGGPKAQAACKTLIQHVQNHDLDSNLEYATHLLNQLRQGEEAQEGMKAFLKKRAPHWIK